MQGARIQVTKSCMLSGSSEKECYRPKCYCGGQRRRGDHLRLHRGGGVWAEPKRIGSSWIQRQGSPPGIPAGGSVQVQRGASDFRLEAAPFHGKGMILGVENIRFSFQLCC